MVVTSSIMNTKIASRSFLVGATQERVWRLIGKVIFSSLGGLEEVEILDETRFRALLRVKVSVLEMKARLNGEIVEMEPPDALGVQLNLEAPGGLCKIIQKVSLKISSVEKERTGVSCKTVAQDMGILFRVLFLKQARYFAQSTFEAIEKRLKELV